MLAFYLAQIPDPVDQDKFEELYELYRKGMLFICTRILRDPFEAEDAVQNALIKVCRNMDKIGEPKSRASRAYMFLAAKNMAINMKKMKERRDKYLNVEEMLFLTDTRMESPTSHLDYQVLVGHIKGMNDVYRDLLTLYYLHNLTLKEIALVLGRNPSTVKVQLGRGKKLLGEILREEREVVDGVKQNG